MSDLKKKGLVGHIVSNVILTIILGAIALLVLFPLYYVIVTSFKDYSTYISNPFGPAFDSWKVQNYIDVVQTRNILRATLNSVILAVIAVSLHVLWTALASFALGFIAFKGSKIIFFLIISTTFFSGEMVYVPLYLMYTKMNLLNTFWVLVIPYLIGISGMGTVIGTRSIKQIPNEIHEAAALDGASIAQVFFRIDLQMLKPVLAYVAITSFQAVWSDFFWPLITVIGNPKVHPLPLMIVGFRAVDSSYFGQYCAGLAIMTVPIVLVYCFFSKYFMKGMTAGAIKG